MGLLTKGIVFSAATATLIGLFFIYKKKKVKNTVKWIHVGEVKSLMVYPLKSAHRLEINSAQCTELGLKTNYENAFGLLDRCLNIYKEVTKENVTSLSHPKILLINAKSTSDDNLELDAPQMPTLNFKIPSLRNSNRECVIEAFMGKIYSIDCGDDAAKWISYYLLQETSGFRLAYSDELRERKVHQNPQLKIFPIFKTAKIGLYSDVGSYLFINQASINDLIDRIPNFGVTVHNFRPNVVIDGLNLKPYEEDNWKWIKIGNAIFHFLKPGVHCPLATINPENITRVKRNEPLRTLKRYRRMRHIIPEIKLETEEVVMGNYYNLHSGEGFIINVGDVIFVGLE